MALRDHEKRELAEIQQFLTEEDPRLAERLANHRLPKNRLAARILLMFALCSTGLIILIVGMTPPSTAMITIGTAVIAGSLVGSHKALSERDTW